MIFWLKLFKFYGFFCEFFASEYAYIHLKIGFHVNTITQIETF